MPKRVLALCLAGVLSALFPRFVVAADVPPYLSGGIGEEEIEYFRLVRNDYNVRLLFAEKDGTYVAGVTLSVADERRESVLELEDAGPYVLIRLPKGVYRIKVGYEGKSTEQRVDLREVPAQERVFRW